MTWPCNGHAVQTTCIPLIQGSLNAMFQDDNTDGRKNYPRNNVNDGTESNNDQSTSEEGKSRKAEITTKSDSANKIETTVTSNAKSDDPSQQSFQTSETNHDGIDTEEQHCDNNTIKIEEGKQADRNRVDEIKSQTEHEHMNIDANQQKGEDGERTNDITMTRSNNDQTTPEEELQRATLVFIILYVEEKGSCLDLLLCENKKKELCFKIN
uniref:Uncharacterized protein n=1 Tax=Magallana gigas TaxID=29159 RepID=K1PDW3_MAGGI